MDETQKNFIDCMTKVTKSDKWNTKTETETKRQANARRLFNYFDSILTHGVTSTYSQILTELKIDRV